MRLVTRIFVFTGFLAMSMSNPLLAEESSAQRLLAIAESLEALQQEIPSYYLSPEAVAESSDYDPEQIVGWVKQNIQFNPSPGYQLTPQASLQTATGNALEQAVLLQNVLVQAGLEVRLAKATLNAEQARTLLRESFLPSPVREWQLESAIREERFRYISRELRAPENSISERYTVQENLTPWPESPVYDKAKNLSEKFSQAISDANAWQPDMDPMQPWLSNTQDYYFVKYRFSQGEPWVAAHPAFAKSSPIIEKSSYATEGIEKEHHQVTIQAFITREVDGKTETIAVSGLHKRTVAELFVKQLQFVTVASGLKKAIEEKSRIPLQQSQFFAPYIDGKLAKNARFFGLDGRDFSPAQVNDPMGKLGGAVSEKVGQMTHQLDAALGKKSAEESKAAAFKSQLLHYYLTIDWLAPNGQKRSLNRTIYRKESAEDPQKIYEAIMQRAILAATPATLTPAAELFESLETQRSILELLAKLKSRKYTNSQVANQLDTWIRSRNDLVFHAAVKLSEEAAGSARLFSQSPVIAMRWDQQDTGAAEKQNSTNNGSSTFDYLINAAQVAVLTGETVSIDQSRTLNYGVWSTYGEALLLSESLQRESLSNDTVSAANKFNKSLSDDTFTVLNAVSLSSGDQTISSSIPPMLSQRIISNPDYVYVLPGSKTFVAPIAYYRVHAVTGEALGYSLDGRGSTSAETTMLLELDIATGVTIGKMAGCFFGADSTGDLLGCAGCALLQYAIGGILILKSVGGAAAAVAAGVIEVPCSFL